MSAEANVTAVASGAEDAAEEFIAVFADYIAPLIGLVVGWALGSQVGGLATVGNLVYNAISTTATTSATKIADVVAAGVMGGIWACLGGALWSASSHFGSKKKWGSAIAKGLLRFLAGVGFGAAIWAVVNGITGNFGEGWIDGVGTTLTKEA